MLDTFQDRLCGIINCHLKLKTRHVKTRTLPPWMDQEVLNHMKQRDTLKRKKLWRAYKQQRNLTNNLIKRKKESTHCQPSR